MQESKLYRIIRPIITILFKFLFTPKIIGKENIPERGKIILAGNHTSNFDCLLLISSTKRSIHFLAKKELWQGPKKIIFNNLGLIPVDRKKKNHESIIKACEYLKSDKVIGIFPEGTTEKENKVLPFKMGVIKIASNTNSDIVPFVINGKYKLFSKDLTITFYKKVSITSNDLEIERKNLEEFIKEKKNINQDRYIL